MIRPIIALRPQIQTDYHLAFEAMCSLHPDFRHLLEALLGGLLTIRLASRRLELRLGLSQSGPELIKRKISIQASGKAQKELCKRKW